MDDETFANRTSLLKDEKTEEYNQVLKDVCEYHNKLQTELIEEAKNTLGVSEEVMVDTIEAYSQKTKVFEHMESVYLEAVAPKRRNQTVKLEEQDKIFAQFNAKLADFHNADPQVDTQDGETAGEEVADTEFIFTLKISDEICIENEINSEELRELIAFKRKENASNSA